MIASDNGGQVIPKLEGGVYPAISSAISEDTKKIYDDMDNKRRGNRSKWRNDSKDDVEGI